MHRCFVSPEEWTGGLLCPGEEEAHHLADVLRVGQDGELVLVFDGNGRQALARARVFRSGRSSRVELEILSEQPVQRPTPRILLVQALPKGGRMDWIIEKAVELGVSEIFPVITERVVARLDARQSVEKSERWRRVAISAAKQCGTAWVPAVRPVADFGAALRLVQADLVLIGSLAPDARPLRAALRELAARPVRSVALLIGPEGDFTPGELQLAAAAGAVGVSFGTLVLRVETAALFGLSVLAYEFSGQTLASDAP